MRRVPFLKNNIGSKFTSLVLFIFVVVAFFAVFFPCSCRLYRLERNLDPVNAEFLSTVRYIITKAERKIFLQLPDEEKSQFRDEFWKRRDPDPYTAKNEFKSEYFSRIEIANDLFVSEGKEGWLTDRGRIHILYGPPTNKVSSPMGGDPLRRCQEIWYYGNFPVYFVDSTCTGNYRQANYDLTPLRSIDLRYAQEFNIARTEEHEAMKKAREKLFDFDLEIKKTVDQEERFGGVVTIKIPYSMLWLKAKEDLFETVLDLELNLKDSEGKIIWRYQDSFEVVIEKESLAGFRVRKHKIEIPVALEKGAARLRQGKNKLSAVIKNRTGEEELRKVVDFEI